MNCRLLAALLISIPAAAVAADAVALTLPEAVKLAIAQNRTRRARRRTIFQS